MSGDPVLVSIRDLGGEPVAGAKATFWFRPLGKVDPQPVTVLSDESGMVSAEGDVRRGFGLRCEAVGHYPARIHDVSPDLPPMEILLPKVLNPIPLHAAHANRVQGVIKSVPRLGVWVGYDLGRGDWTAPDGKGEYPDVLLKLTNQFSGYSLEKAQLDRAKEISKKAAAREGRGWAEEELQKQIGRWESVLEIKFAAAKEGLLKVDERYLAYNRLKLPHRAPESEYIPSIRIAASTHEPNRGKDVGYFLRTRVKLDEAGEIVSANYAKIYGEFVVDPRGSVSFLYYFNPTPNDRNLEFDPSRNLFPPDFPGADVRDP